MITDQLGNELPYVLMVGICPPVELRMPPLACVVRPVIFAPSIDIPPYFNKSVKNLFAEMQIIFSFSANDNSPNTPKI